MTKTMGSGRVAFFFDDRDEFIRCLEEVSRYQGLTCEVAPWRVIIMPDLLAKVCRKRGIVPARVMTKLVRPDDESDEAREEHVHRMMARHRQMLEEAGIIAPAR